MIYKQIIIVTSAIIFATHSTSIAANQPSTATSKSKQCTERLRLLPYEPNWFIWIKPDYDDATLRSHLSFSYDISSLNNNISNSNCLFFSYTGEFDFYLSTRESSPVINRINNPALHWRYQELQFINWLDVGLQHKSNGQAGTITTIAQISQARQASFNHQEYYFDGLSRSENYISTTINIGNPSNTSYWISVKHYLKSSEDAVYWGKYSDGNISLQDFEKYKLTINKKIHDGEISFEWIWGNTWLANDSADISYARKILGEIPIYIRYHAGPMNNLSNYSQSNNYIGIGIKLYPFRE